MSDAPQSRFTRRRAAKVFGSLVVTGLAVAYLVWKIDIGQTAHILANAKLGFFFASLAIMIISVWPMAWRWQRLLAARGVHERLSWLTRAYFVSYLVGQVLPTSIGGDASRIYETSRRNPGRGGLAAGTVLLERALGGAATLTLAAIGFVLAIGQYNLGAYLWIEGLFVVLTIILAFAMFSRTARGALRWTVPYLRRLRVEKPLRAVYEAIHSYRDHPWLLVGMFVLTIGVQAVRVLSIWLAGKAVGVDLPPRPYYVMGPMLFLVILIPFTINGLAVRESFFVSFLGGLGVSADQAFATGFLFFLVTLLLSVPGAAIMAWESVRGVARPSLPHG